MLQSLFGLTELEILGARTLQTSFTGTDVREQFYQVSDILSSGDLTYFYAFTSSTVDVYSNESKNKFYVKY